MNEQPAQDVIVSRRPASAPSSDALVFFGATGDPAYKQIFPALQNMIWRQNLNVPIIGVAKSGWTIDKLRARAHDSLAQHKGGVNEGAFAKLAKLLQYVDGDYQDPATFDKLRKTLGRATCPATTWPFRPACLAASSNLWENLDVLKTRVSSSKSPSGMTSCQHRN